MRDTMSTPNKLKIADIRTAFRGESDFVAIQEEMAFGASVQPFTKITPHISAKVIAENGEESRLCNWVIYITFYYCRITVNIYETVYFSITKKNALYRRFFVICFS